MLTPAALAGLSAPAVSRVIPCAREHVALKLGRYCLRLVPPHSIRCPSCSPRLGVTELAGVKREPLVHWVAAWVGQVVFPRSSLVSVSVEIRRSHLHMTVSPTRRSHRIIQCPAFPLPERVLSRNGRCIHVVEPFRALTTLPRHTAPCKPFFPASCLLPVELLLRRELHQPTTIVCPVPACRNIDDSFTPGRAASRGVFVPWRLDALAEAAVLISSHLCFVPLGRVPVRGLCAHWWGTIDGLRLVLRHAGRSTSPPERFLLCHCSTEV